MADITFNGLTMEYRVVESMMDSDLKVDIESVFLNLSEQAFLNAYMDVHKLKFGKEFLQD
jgi:hypothetical protein